MSYVLYNSHNKLFVETISNSSASYTKDLDKAKIFSNYKFAKKIKVVWHHYDLQVLEVSVVPGKPLTIKDMEDLKLMKTEEIEGSEEDKKKAPMAKNVSTVLKFLNSFKPKIVIELISPTEREIIAYMEKYIADLPQYQVEEWARILADHHPFGLEISLDGNVRINLRIQL